MQNLVKCLFFISFFFSLGISGGYAQEKKVDSLKALLQNPKIHDTLRLNILANLIESTSVLEDEIITYNNKTGHIASKNLQNKNLSPVLRNTYLKYLADYYNNMGVLDNGPKAIAYLDKSIRIFRNLKMDSEMYGAITSKGGNYAAIGDNYNAIGCFFESIKYFESIKETQLIVYPLYQLGTVYHHLKNETEAIKYYKKALAYVENQQFKKVVADQSTATTIYGNIGTCYLSLKKYAEAASYFETAVKMARENKDAYSTGLWLTGIGIVKKKTGKTEEALKLFLEAQSLSVNQFTEANVLLRLGELYYSTKKYDEAEKNLVKGYEISKQMGNGVLQEQATEVLYKVYDENHKYQKALETLKAYNTIKDSSKVESSKNALVQQQLKYDYEKKAFQYELKNAAKNNWLIALFSALGLLLIGIYFLYRNYKQKQAISTFEKNEIKQKLLVTQMNPHFIFNSIDNIQSLIYKKQDKEAVNYLTKFSKLTRQILENSNENYIPLCEELAMIDNYLVIQQLLYNNAFDFKITVTEDIDTQVILLPPMLTQPFIENAIKHGIRDNKDKGMIVIRFFLEASKLFFEVTDNGNGFNASQKQTAHKSLAMTITKERLINYSRKSDFVVQTENILDQDEKIVGAKVQFEVPYVYEK